MNLKKIIFLLICVSQLFSCAEYQTKRSIIKEEKKYYSSLGFALVYEDQLFNEKAINRKINNNNIVVMHSILRRNTQVKIINPDNLKFIETKIKGKAVYSSIFNVAISKKISHILELDIDNPYVEVLEIKKNKTFIAKEGSTFDEEKNVAGKAPVEKIKMNDLSISQSENKKKESSKGDFILVINDFYYEESALGLKNELVNKTNINNIFIKKISDNKYRLLAGPFKNFNALKTIYISLNNLGFENLDIYKE